MSETVFISYSRADLAYVRRLFTHLTRAGIAAWMDEEVRVGEPWREEIGQRILDCSALLLVMSTAAAQSEWVIREVQYAQHQGKPILPLLLDGDVIFGLGHLQFEDVAGLAMPSPAFIDQLRGTIPHHRVVRHLIGQIPEAAHCYQVRRAADDLERVISSASINSEIPNRAAILSGPGGVGKTQVAAAAARRMRDSGSLDILLWLRADGPETIVSGFARASTEILGIDATDAPEAARSFLEWLATTTSTWLIVLDDLVDPRHLVGWWPPRTATGWSILTTRRRDAALATHAELLAVGPFARDESIAYLSTKFAGRSDRLVGADTLVEDLDHLPLALAQAAAYIDDRSITCAQYCAEFADRRRTLRSLSPEVLPDGYLLPISVTLALSIDAANDMEPVGLARPLLAMLAVLDGAGVPFDVPVSPSTSDYLVTARGPGSASGEPTLVDDEDISMALACLTRLNLADIADDNGWRRISVHSLVQRAMRELTPQSLLQQAIGAATESLISRWTGSQYDWRVEQAMRANTQALQSRDEEAFWRLPARVLLTHLGLSLINAGLYSAAVDHFRHVADEFERRLGPDHPDSFGARHDLAMSHAPIDKDTAITTLEALLRDRVRVFGPDHRESLATRYSLARVGRSRHRWPTGRFRSAAEFKALLADQLRVLGPDHPDTLATRHELAYSYGSTRRIVRALRKLATDQTRVLGPDHPDTLNTRASLGLWRSKHGLLGAWPGGSGRAAELESVVAAYERVLGRDHPNTLAAHRLLAFSQALSGDTGFGNTVNDLATLHLARYGPDHPLTEESQAWLASVTPRRKR